MRYSDVIRDHFFQPRNVGKLAKPTHAGVAGTPGQGPFMVFQLEVVDERISAAAFRTYGCPPAIAAGSLLTEWIKGQSLADAAAISQDELEQRLGGLPRSKRHCAALAIEGLRRTIAAEPEARHADR